MSASGGPTDATCTLGLLQGLNEREVNRWGGTNLLGGMTVGALMSCATGV